MEPHSRAQARRAADDRAQRALTAADGAATATGDAAADAADLALGLGGPAFATAAAVAAFRLSRHLAVMAEQLTAMADVLRDDHLAQVRGRLGHLPDDYLRDVLGPGHIGLGPPHDFRT